MHRIQSAFLVFLFGAAFGLYHVRSSWDGIVYYPVGGDPRSPAAIQSMYDFSNLKGAALNNASKERLIVDAKIEYRDQSVFISLGNFVSMNKNGHKEFVCTTYDMIEMRFVVDGFAVNGVQPQMVAKAQCGFSPDSSHLAPVIIPFGDLTQMPAKNQVWDFWTNYKLNIETIAMDTQWHKEWTLTYLRVYRSNDESISVEISKGELALLLSSPLLINFK